MLVGIVVSLISGKRDLRCADPDLISPLSRWMLPPEAQRYAGTALRKTRNIEQMEEMKMNDGQPEGNPAT